MPVGKIGDQCFGHMVSREGLKPQQQKVDVITNWPQPKNKDELSRFLGLCGYYWRFIPSFADITSSLFDAIKKDFQWTQEHQDDFSKLKEAMTEQVTLKLPDPYKTFSVTCDASKVAVGYVLEQEEDGELRPICFGSRKLKPAERNYSATELECLAVVEAVRAFRAYLLGKEFILQTDHQALKWLLTHTNPEGRLWRWVYKLSEFSFSVEHRPGKGNLVADALSRVNAVSIDHEWSLEEIVTEQKQDPELASLRRELQKKNPKLGPYSPVKGSLSLDPASELILCGERIVLPKSLQITALESLHDHGGHIGRDAMMQRVQDRFYWPSWRSETEHWVKCCVTCQERNPLARRTRVPLGEMPLPTQPFEYVQLDLKGPLPETPSHNKYLLMVYDHFFKYVEAIPILNKRTETVVEAFVSKIVCRYGIIPCVNTDLGKEFESHLMRATLEQFGIVKSSSSVSHPASNGGVERANRTMGNLLRLVAREDQTDWDDQVTYCTFAYNASRHLTTKHSPYEIVYGLWKQYLPCDATLQRHTPAGSGSPAKQPMNIEPRLIKPFSWSETACKEFGHISNWRARRDQILCQFKKEKKCG